MKPLHRLALAKFILLCLWPVTVSAAIAIETTRNPFDGVTVIQVAVMGLVALLSGMTAFVIRLDQEYKTQRIKKQRKLSLFAASHMLGSILAGILAFALSQHNSFTIWWQLSFVIAASFTGAKFVEQAACALLRTSLKK